MERRNRNIKYSIGNFPVLLFQGFMGPCFIARVLLIP